MNSSPSRVCACEMGSLTLAAVASPWIWGQLNYSVAHRGHHVWRSINRGGWITFLLESSESHSTPIIQAYPLSNQQMLFHSSLMACRFHLHCHMEFPLSECLAFLLVSIVNKQVTTRYHCPIFSLPSGALSSFSTPKNLHFVFENFFTLSECYKTW